MFRQWALEKGLKPSETRYVRRTRTGTVDLQFSKSGDPAIEKNYRTHYISPSLSERKQEQLTQKLSGPAQPVVFEILRGSACSECGAELAQGSFLVMEAEQPLCLPCARLGDLEFLPAGDAALTRRAAKYSDRTAVVVRFSRSRGRYERQGILVENSALERAEQECLEDAWDARKARAAEAAAAAGTRPRTDRPDDAGDWNALSRLSAPRGGGNRGAHGYAQQRTSGPNRGGAEIGCGRPLGCSNLGGPSSTHRVRCDACGRHGSPSRQAADRRSGAGDSGGWRDRRFSVAPGFLSGSSNGCAPDRGKTHPCSLTSPPSDGLSKARHKARFPAMFPADFGDQRLPPRQRPDPAAVEVAGERFEFAIWYLQAARRVCV